MSTTEAPEATPKPKLYSRGGQIVVAIAVTILVTAILIFFTRAQSKAVTATLVGYKPVSATEFDVTFSVTKSYLAQVTCDIQALDAKANIIGEDSHYVIGPQINHHRTTTHTVELTVTGVPVTGEVYSCIVTRNH